MTSLLVRGRRANYSWITTTNPPCIQQRGFPGEGARAGGVVNTKTKMLGYPDMYPTAGFPGEVVSGDDRLSTEGPAH